MWLVFLKKKWGLLVEVGVGLQPGIYCEVEKKGYTQWDRK